MISSLTGTALRTLVDIVGKPRDSTCVLKAEPGKLHIRRREPGILFINLPIVSLFKLAIMAYLFYFCVDSVSLATSFKKYNVIMIKAHAVK